MFIAGFGVEQPLADAWRTFQPILAEGRGYHQFLGELDGRVVAASALMTHRRVGWLGAGTVLPEARGREIQRALIAHRAAVAAELGCTKVMATAEAGFVSAANLTASQGCRLFGAASTTASIRPICPIRRTTTT